jgi:hypothetical protein
MLELVFDDDGATRRIPIRDGLTRWLPVIFAASMRGFNDPSSL